jgi:hypothetical protein
VVTNFSIFLLFTSYFSLKKEFKLNKLLWHLFSLIILIISKAPLIIPYFLFLFFDNYKNNKRYRFLNYFIIFFSIILIFSVIFIFQSIIIGYSENISLETSQFSYLTGLPLVGFIFKYLYAIVSPFPWYDFNWFKSNYSGNIFLSITHISSSILALQFFLILIFERNKKFNFDPQLKTIVLFFSLMSLSIIFGTTGYHSYLLIFFSIASPLLFIKKYFKLYILNFSFLFFLNLILFLVKF